MHSLLVVDPVDPVDPVWEAISQLERQGIRVMALTYDGASTN